MSGYGDGKDRAIAAQNALTSAATVYAAIVAQRGDVEFNPDEFDSIRQYMFNGTLDLATSGQGVTSSRSAAERVKDAFPGAEEAEQERPQRGGSNGRRPSSNGDDAGSIDIRSGKHRGKTIAQVYEEEPTYLDWVIDKSPNKFLRDKVEEFLATV